ncbi:hypothetical protein GOODEAATRI_020699 [Goodea atripinnis]|uniref:Uncharacterized protein n=1 Tax=Goodea atripinnis TaxID=208336 RepID=A0ABV0MJG1_9TELE
MDIFVVKDIQCHKNAELIFKETTRTNLVKVCFLLLLQSSGGIFSLSDLHTAASLILTRRWPNCFFLFNIPLDLAHLSAPLTKHLKETEKKTRLLTLQESSKLH